MNTIEIIPRALGLTLICLSGNIIVAQKANPADDDSGPARQITLDRFNKARPPNNSLNAGTPAVASRRGRNRIKPPIYRRTTPRHPSSGPTDDIGITVWRLRPSRSSDKGARVLVLDGLKQEKWIPERIEASTPLQVGDRVRLAIESPRPGFLYIVDREQYADGAFGEAMLIFPTLKTRGGDNRVLPGKLIDIPAQEDQYSYFTAQPAGERRDQIAEVLSFILLPQPLDLKIAEQPLKIARRELGGWEKLWGGPTEVLELVGGMGRAWTSEEKEAGAVNGRQLTQSGPPPQTVYRVTTKAAGTLLVTVPLRYGR